VASKGTRLAIVGTLVLLLLGTVGCATKKWVQTSAIEPLEAKIKGVDTKVDQKSSELDTKITDLDRKTEQGISAAQTKADSAGQEAQKAKEAAQGAQQTADKGMSEVAATRQEIDNIDNYQSVKTETVQFAVDHSELTPEDQTALDGLAQTLSGLKHYAIEVRGFTDATGSKPYNLELSRRRADAVVRYLTVNLHVPLVKIHQLGLGESEPAADNKTSAGRKENRRVEIRVLAPQVSAK
jgi:OOP family OmpA-OmpF porin